MAGSGTHDGPQLPGDAALAADDLAHVLLGDAELQGELSPVLGFDLAHIDGVRIVHQALWGACGIDCEFCSGCDNRGGGRVESIYQPYIDGEKEIREINAEYSAPIVRG